MAKAGTSPIVPSLANRRAGPRQPTLLALLDRMAGPVPFLFGAPNRRHGSSIP